MPGTVLAMPSVSSLNEPSVEPSAGSSPELSPRGATADTRTSGRVPARPPLAAGTLAVTTGATFLLMLDYTAPMTVLPDMSASLGSGTSGQAWLLNGIALGLAAMLLAAGGLADERGRKRVFVGGTLALAVTMLLGAATTGTLGFTLARVAQGGAGAAVLAASLGLLGHTFPSGRARVRATALWGAALSGGIACGPLLSSSLTAVSWRACYVVYGLAAVGVAALSARTLQESSAPRRSRFDLLGVLALGLSLSALFAALTVGRTGWLSPPTLGLFGVAAALAGVFVWAERRGVAAVLDPALFRRPLFLAATLGALFTGAAVVGLFSYVPTLLRRTTELSALDTAWLFALWSGTALVAAVLSRRLPPRISARHQLALGFGLSALGTLGLLDVVQPLSWARLPAALVVAGTGSGLLNAALPRLAVESVPPERVAMGSGANNTARYVGSGLGVALTVALASAHGGVDAHGGAESVRAVRTLAHGTDVALLTAAGLALVGAVSVLALRDRPAGSGSRSREPSGR